jgi:translation elongation factor EF-Tu-like GTPase
MSEVTFTEGEWHSISGRGNVYATEMPIDYPKTLLGETVTIEDYDYIVTGVEMFAVLDNSLYKGRQVGILVRGRILSGEQ